MDSKIEAFRKIVWQHYKKNGRHDLPWRKTTDPYKIMVSEVMLQQTQVERVIPFYTSFIKKWPTPKRLAEASLSDVLRAWQGLGYNRRAKMLQKAAQEIVEQYKGVMPANSETLQTLSGIGPYTAGAICAFAFNTDGIFIETNIRTVITHHFFPKAKKVSDEKIMPILKDAFTKGKSREWYSALMDYGTHLKASGIRINAKSKHYTKQKAFKGSAREARGIILRALAEKPMSEKALKLLTGEERAIQVQKLLAEGMIQKHGRTYTLAT